MSVCIWHGLLDNFITDFENSANAFTLTVSFSVLHTNYQITAERVLLWLLKCCTDN